ncbi:MAG: carboxypeptidase regulatory-like domain-containing protein [Planctomycetes bacterium]|nr:carboxypeptidase regulatory-like domain-containing protein [Planctomycetota bacterium]
MQRNRSFVFVLIPAVVALATWMAWPRADVAPAPPSGEPAATTGHSTPEVVEHGGTPPAAPDAVERQAAPLASTAASVGPAGGEAVLVGKVVDEGGRPLAGASVVAMRSRSPDERGRRLVEERAARTASSRTDERPHTETDAEGQFRLAAGPAGEALFVRVRGRGYRVLDRSLAKTVAGDNDLGALSLKIAAVVSGRVVDAAGAPVAGARVTRTFVRPKTGDGADNGGWPMGDFGDIEFPDFEPDDVPFAEVQEGLDFPGSEFVRDMLDPGSRTDAEGRFELAHCDPGEFALRARHPEHPSVRREGLTVAAGATLRDLVLTMAPGATIAGRVVGAPENTTGLKVLVATVRNDGPAVEGPLAGIGPDVTEMMGDFGGFGEREGAVAADGSFAVRGLHVGRTYRVWITQSAARGPALGTVCSQRVELRAPAERIELRYDPGVVVTFQVVDGAGAPIERLWVRDRLRGGGGMSDLMSMVPRSGGVRSYPDGRVTLSNLRPKKGQTLSLTVEAVRFRAYERGDIVLPLAGSLDLGIVRLEAAPALDVVVRAKDTGTPVGGAQVRARPAQQDAPRDGNPFERIANRVQSEGGPRSARTDENGACTLNVPSGVQVVVEVTSQDFAPFASEAIAAPAAGTVAMTADLLRGGVVEVVVVDTAGAPAAAARVQHAPPAGDRVSRNADREGRVVFTHLAPGEHAFRLTERSAGPDFAEVAAEMRGERVAPTEPGWQKVTVVDGVRTELRLTKDPAATLRGFVRENGKPLAGARLTFLVGAGDDTQPAEGLASMMAEMGGGDGGRAGRSADDGSFELKNLKAGAHRVRVTGKGRAMPTVVAVTLQPGENVFDLLLTSAVVRGVVFDPAGAPVAGASVSVAAVAPRVAGKDPLEDAMDQIAPGFDPAGLAGAARSVKTDEQGRYELRGVQPGTQIVVRATAKSLAGAQSEPLELATNAERDGVDVHLLAAGKVRVTMAEPKAFASAQARLLDAAGEVVRGAPPVVQMLGSGSGTLSGLRPGRWRIDLIVPAGGSRQSRTVDVTAGETANVTF